MRQDDITHISFCCDFRVNRGKMDMIKLLEIEWLWGKKRIDAVNQICEILPIHAIEL